MGSDRRRSSAVGRRSSDPPSDAPPGTAGLRERRFAMDERNVFEVGPEKFSDMQEWRPRLFLAVAVLIAFLGLAAFAA
jgi:hypothetical protein